MMAADIARCLDPTLLARAVGLVLDEWQSRLLRDMPRRALLCCSRQSGKSTIAVLLAIWFAIYKPGSLILLVSASQRQSAELFRSLMVFYSKLTGAPELVAESVLRAQLSNGSRIIALPGTEKTIRGYSKADLVILDEASRIEDEMLAAIRPTMAVAEGGGTLLALSTPAGRRGWFYESWEHGGDDWARVRVPASACPRISKEVLADELKQLGPLRFSEEYELAFIDDQTAVWNMKIINEAFVDDVRPLWT